MDDTGFVLITGAAGGLGIAAAKLLSQNTNLILTDLEAPIDLANEIQNDTNKIVTYDLDVTKSTSVENMVSMINQNNYKITGLVCLAGITRDRTLLKMTEAEWDQVINVNLKGTYNVIKALGDVMKRNGGSMITVGSAVTRFGNYGQSNYIASKAAVEAFTRTVARELARYGIRVNCIVPGFIETPMALAIPKDRFEMVVKSIPVGRVGKPEEVADLIEFLLSDKSSYITGTSIQIDGGLRMSYN